jgi:hypothetical protein
MRDVRGSLLVRACRDLLVRPEIESGKHSRKSFSIFLFPKLLYWGPTTHTASHRQLTSSWPPFSFSFPHLGGVTVGFFLISAFGKGECFLFHKGF